MVDNKKNDENKVYTNLVKFDKYKINIRSMFTGKNNLSDALYDIANKKLKDKTLHL